MLCPQCHNDMLLDRVEEQGRAVFCCVNPRCPGYRSLTPNPNLTPTQKGEQP